MADVQIVSTHQLPTGHHWLYRRAARVLYVARDVDLRVVLQEIRHHLGAALALVACAQAAVP